MVRRALEHDARAIAELHIASWRATYAQELSQSFLENQDLLAWAAEWERKIAAGLDVFIAEQESALVGFVACGWTRAPAGDDAEWEIHNLHTLPGHHSRGIGSRLFEAAAELGRQRDARRLVLWVVTTNTHARAFYERRGMNLDGGEQEHRVESETLHEVRYGMPL